MSTFRRFSEATTIHGLQHVSKEISRWKRCKLHVWLVVICLSTFLCLWQCCIDVQVYLSYDVTTATYYELDKQLAYPTITIWNVNDFRRTVVGRHQAMIMMATMNGGDSQGIAKLYYQMNKTCYYEPPSHDRVDDILDSLDITALGSQTLDTIMKILNFAMVNKKMNFFKCFRREIEVDCETIILTTLMESHLGYSFNLDTNVVENFMSNESGLGALNKNYVPVKEVKYLESAGIENGLKFILNVNQDEYCLNSLFTWFGAGFQLKLHDPKALPSDQFGTSISLSPGYQFDIAIKPTRHVRNTVNLGRCLRSYPMYMFPDSEGYTQELCFVQCENELVWQRCGCLSTWLRQAGRAFARHHKLDENRISLGCVGANRPCLFEMIEIAKSKGIENVCPQCKQPCDETVYIYKITVTQFPPNHLVSYYSEHFNITNKVSIKNNFLMVNIYFESLSAEVVIENQMFTTRDLFIYLGNSIGLFLGMSFMSFAEFLYFLPGIMNYIVVKAKAVRQKLKRRTRVRAVKIVQAPRNVGKKKRTKTEKQKCVETAL